MMFRPIAALVFVTITLSIFAASWDDDSHYVSLGPRNGYYIVQPDSPLIRQLGLFEAPWINTADPLRHGYGADALAFRFNRNSVLIAPPAYIAQSLPYDFYMCRIGSLIHGRLTAILTATDHPRAGSRWIETDDNWSLQNILIALFGQPAPGLP